MPAQCSSSPSTCATSPHPRQAVCAVPRHMSALGRVSLVTGGVSSGAGPLRGGRSGTEMETAVGF